jgi:hypothetical protein
MPRKASPKPVVKAQPVQQVFHEKPITDAPPKTFPLIPEKVKGFCDHVNRQQIEGEDGFNCLDCGFFVPYEQEKPPEKKVEKPIHTAEIHEVEKVPMPKLNDNYQILEIKRAVFDVDGDGFVKEEGAVGEKDRRVLSIFQKYINSGYKIKSLQQTESNSYLFLFEK